ncbi:MAG: hypothetical protein HC814_08510, partial [Rhodobacteraceae bacterium]|nr:hypothetical protein [Paracoccaceae bacterium]
MNPLLEHQAALTRRQFFSHGGAGGNQWHPCERFANLFPVNHELQDAVGLELARQVAARLRAAPELLSVAQENLDRWSRLNAGTPSLLRCYAES